ncbi:MAG TPA: hypothetical protein VH419_04945 [Nocardioidaceae bacterium]
MLNSIRRHLTTILVAMVTAIVTAGAPALAQGVQNVVVADNSDKVDGKHAVGAGASVAQRAGKLVATNQNGRLPDSIIAKAPDANLVDGIDSANLLPGGTLPHGVTIRGHYANMGTTDGANLQSAAEGISFGYRLASAPTPVVIHAGEPQTADCPGTAANPDAAPGFLCVYENDAQNKRDASYPHVAVGFAGGSTTPFGAYIYTQSNTAAPAFFWSRGSWAVTAP